MTNIKLCLSGVGKMFESVCLSVCCLDRAALLQIVAAGSTDPCKIPVYHWVSGHRVHRHCLCGSPAYLGRPDPLSFKWIGGQFKSGLARRNWPSFCSTGGL